MGIAAAAALTLGCFVYMFWPVRGLVLGRDKTRVEYLRERRDVIYDNLRDLNFEYLAGKYPERDYLEQRRGLEDEAAGVVGEMEALESRGLV